MFTTRARLLSVVLSCLLLAALAFASPVLTAETTTKVPPAAEAKSVTADATQPKTPSTPVFVELEGTDTIGAKLSMQLQEMFNSGTLFTLTAKDEPKIRILISTKPEFTSRPGVGSAYSVIWLYHERSTAFTSYLASEVGVVSLDEVPALAMRIAERTTGLAAKYSYIFK
ncbi:hypothetical protein [Desulfovibrio cuneatus]|uniref:hypothetical protein n=1 Tax=Desulfovibrio cuneatus TaxID=159728 RepID=UPI0003F5EFFE|nr:hypothetical protein [Desulfovibrio cuneatus]